MDTDFDVVVIGGGVPGEHCVAGLAEGGLRVALVERELVGGECSYWACIPSKTLLRPGEAVPDPNQAAATAGADMPAALAWRDFMVSDYSDAAQQRWLADKDITVLRGTGRLAGPPAVEVDGQRLTGAYALGPGAAESLQQATLAIRVRVPVEVLRDTIQPFPTFSEIYVAAVKVLRGQIASVRQAARGGS